MASFKGLGLSHLFFVVILTAVLSLPAEARESRFFSKMVRGEPLVGTTAVLPEVSSTTVVEEAAKLPPQSRHGYGLYGHRSNQLPTSTATTTTTSTAQSYHNFEAVPSNEFQNNNNNKNEFSSGRYDNFDPNAVYTNYADPSKQYGMSDTRYLDNGRYFYDLNTARSRDDQYEDARENKGRYAAGYENLGKGPKGDGFEFSNNDEGEEFHTGIENQENGDQYVP